MSQRDEQRTNGHAADSGEEAPVALFVLARDGSVLGGNEEADALLARSEGSEAPLIDRLSPASAEIWRDHLEAVFRSGGAQGCRLDVVEAGGGTGSYAVRTVADRPEGERCRSAWMRLDAETDREAQLLRRLERAEAALRERAAFLARFSHEVRSALASMVGFADLLRDEIAEEQRELADSIRLSGRHLLDTLAAVMDVASQEVRGPEGRVPVDLVAHVRERAQALGPLARKKGLRFDVRIDSEPVVVAAHPVFLDRVLHNLIENAIKYTPAGRVEVSVEAREGSGWIYVADTGLGMDRAFMPRLFSPFEREQRGAARTDGSGLGLTITKQLVEGMGGRIYVCSVRDEGSTFTVTLPLAEPEAESV